MKQNIDKRLEVHRHTYISGPNAGHPSRRDVFHSHEGGDNPHQHLDTGPATYTIDKDDWFRTTGLRGGARKKFTAKPTGPQLQRVELEAWQRSFRIIVGPPPKGHHGEGGGLAMAVRMVRQFKMEIE